MHNLSCELFYFRQNEGCSLGGSTSVSSETLTAPGRQEGSPAIYKFVTNGAGSLNMEDQVSN